MTLKRYVSWRGATVALADAGTMTLVFSFNGIYDMRIDGASYVGQVESFASGMSSLGPGVAERQFKPLYPIIGGTILHVSDPELFMLVMNCLFLIMLAGASYAVLRLLDFSKNESAIGTIWIVTAYPVLKYGLALGTDISGWAFTILTLAVGLYALRRDSLFWLCVASLIGFLGSISKETGVLGLIAVALLVLWRNRKTGAKRLVGRTAAIGAPAALLYCALIIAPAGHTSTFLGWYAENTASYAGQYYHSFYWALVEISTFGLFWLFSILGIFELVRKDQRSLDYCITAFMATLPVLLWPIFISRVLFIQFIWVIPLSLLGLRYIQGYMDKRGKGRTSAAYAYCIIAAAPVALNVALFIIGHNGSFFSLLK